jgi:hypothetical protein
MFTDFLYSVRIWTLFIQSNGLKVCSKLGCLHTSFPTQLKIVVSFFKLKFQVLIKILNKLYDKSIVKIEIEGSHLDMINDLAENVTMVIWKIMLSVNKS